MNTAYAMVVITALPVLGAIFSFVTKAIIAREIGRLKEDLADRFDRHLRYDHGYHGGRTRREKPPRLAIRPEDECS